MTLQLEARVLREAAQGGRGGEAGSPACRGHPPGKSARLDHFTDIATEALAAAVAMVWLRRGRELVVASSAGTSRWLTRRELTRRHALWAEMMAARGPVAVADTQARSELRDDALMAALGAGACAVVPLPGADGEPLGAFCVFAREPREWTARDIAILEALAAGVAAELRGEREAAERRQMVEAKVRLQESVARTLADMPLELGLTDRRGRYLYLTSSIFTDRDGCRSLFGRTDRDYCRLRGLPPAIAEARLQAIRTAVRERRLVEIEESFEDEGGARHFARFVAPLPEVDGRIRRVLSTGVEITRRKEFEAALRASEARYRHLVEQASEMICQTDTEGRFTYVNPVAERLTGYPVSELLGMHYFQLIRPDYRERMEEFYREQERTGALSSYYEFPGVTADGREVWMGQSLQPLIERGRHVGAQAVARDITERRRAEEALRASEARTAAIVNTSLDGVISMSGDGSMVEFNPAAEALFGYAAADLLGKPAPFLIRSPVLEEAFRRALADPMAPMPAAISGQRLEAMGVRADGGEFPMEISITSTVDHHGGRVYTGFVRDITARKRVEAALMAATNAAQSASRAKSALLATMTHEIRTPMNAILGATELLLEGHLDADSVELATMVETNAQAMLVLLNAFLDSAKIEAGQLQIKDAPFDPRDLLDDVVETLGAAAGAKGLELVASVEPVVPAPLLGDAVRIRQVLLNLGDNAVKFTSRGEVAIHADLALGAAASGERPDLHFTVRDTGVGISASDRERIFQPFTQVSSDGQRSRGTGLGLGISRSLVRLMGGRLELESEPGHGSTFHIYLPLRVAEATGAAEAVGERLAGVHVLVLALPGSLRNMISGVLRRAGADVAEAASAHEALARVQEGFGNGNLVVIADDAVPGFAGLQQLVRRMARHAGRRPRVVVLCAPDSAQGGYRAGAGGVWLRRPVRPRGLLRAVERVRSQPRARAVTPAAAAAAPLPAARPGARILLVEDSREERMATGRLLQAAQFAVDVARTGERAVALAAATRYDAILMDLDLPGMNGFAAAEAIRAGERDQERTRAPILALTGLTGKDVRERAAASGMDGFLSKPVAPDALVEAISRALEPGAAILIAEDAPDARALMQRCLAGAKYRLVFAADGRQAVEAFARQAFSLVVLDLEMPVMDGYAAARAIRLMRHGALVPIVALTGHEQGDVQARWLEAGFTSYIQKPVRQAELRAAITAALAANAAAWQAPSTGHSRGPSRLQLAKRISAEGRELLLRFARMREGSGRRDPSTVATAGTEAARTAERLGLPDLARVCGEAALAARSGDGSLAAFWTERVADELPEAARILAVRELRALAAESRASFAQVTRFAASALGVPIAVVSLLDAHRQVVLDQVGLQEGAEAQAIHPFCRHVMLSRDVLLEQNAGDDPLVRSHPVLRDLGVAAYAGVPLTTGDGYAVGTFCVMDTAPRKWGASDVWLLRVLSSFVAAELDTQRGRAPAPSESAPGRTVLVESHIADLVPSFLANRGKDARRIPELLQEDQMEEIRRIAHNMKSCSAGYGFAEMSVIARELEVASREGDRERVRALAHRLEAHVASVTWRVAEPDSGPESGRVPRSRRWTRRGMPRSPA